MHVTHATPDAPANRLRLIYLGSGAFGLPTLKALHADPTLDLVAVVSQPDKPAGRHRKLTPTPVCQWVLNLPEQVRPELLRAEDCNTPGFIARLAALEPDAAVVIAFGQKLSPELIAALGRLAVNLHASLLPRYRGAAPIHHALMANEKTTGVSVIALAQRMDAGAVYGTAVTDIDPRETTGELHDRLAELGPGAVLGVLDDLRADRLTPVEQDESLACKAPKLDKQRDGTTGFDRPADDVRARVHGLNPWPGCTVRWEIGRVVEGRYRPGADDGDATSDDPKTLILRRVAVMDSVPVFIRTRLQAGERFVPGQVLDQLLIACGPANPDCPDGTIDPDTTTYLRPLELQAPGTVIMKADAFAAGHGLTPGHRLLPLTPPAQAPTASP